MAVPGEADLVFVLLVRWAGLTGPDWQAPSRPRGFRSEIRPEDSWGPTSR